MLNTIELNDCLGLLHRADAMLVDSGESLIAAHLSLVIELLRERLPAAER